MSKENQKKSGTKKVPGSAGEKAPKATGEGSHRASMVASKKQGTKTIAAKDDSAPKPKSAAKSSANTAAKPVKEELLMPSAKAPSFFLPRDGGQFLSLASFSGRKLVLFFYPRADTPGCTIEAKDFSRLAADFAASQTAVVGVSADPLRAQEAFRDKHELSIPLVSDETQDMLRKYGAWGEKSMYGKVFEGVLRSTVLIDTEGNVMQVWRNVKVDGHAEQVLEAVQAS